MSNPLSLRPWGLDPLSLRPWGLESLALVAITAPGTTAEPEPEPNE